MMTRAPSLFQRGGVGETDERDGSVERLPMLGLIVCGFREP